MNVVWNLHDPAVAVFDQLARASIDGGLFVLAVLLLVRLLPALPARALAAAWWLASVRFLVGLAWVAPVAVPVLPAGMFEQPVWAASSVICVALECPGTSKDAVAEDSPCPDDALASPALPPADTAFAGPGPSREVDPRALATLAWVVLTVAVFGRTVRRVLRTRRLLREAAPADARLHSLAAGAAERLGLRRVPAIRVTGEAVPPQVVWLVRPTVLLAARDVARLSDEDLSWLIAHELLHVRRRDGWWAWGPALAGHLFAAHPLARLAVREFVTARESACDLGVLEHAGATPRDYGRLLLRLGVARTARATALAASPSSLASLEEEIAHVGTLESRRAPLHGPRRARPRRAGPRHGAAATGGRALRYGRSPRERRRRWRGVVAVRRPAAGPACAPGTPGATCPAGPNRPGRG